MTALERVRAIVDDSTTWTVTSLDQLRSVMGSVADLPAPTMLFLEDDGGATLVVGLGAPETVLCFVEPDGTSFHSVGDLSRTGTLVFSCRSQPDEFPEEMAVPTSVGIHAAESFFENRAKPGNVSWEADW